MSKPEVLVVCANDGAEILAVSRAQFFKLNAAGRIPAPVQLGTRAPRWRVDELRGWLAAGGPSRAEWERMKSSGKGVTLG